MAYAFDIGANPSDLPNPRRCLREGRPIVGASLHLGSAIIAEMMAQLGLDFVYIDQQHGLVSYDTTLALLRAVDRTRTAPLVRVATNESHLIGQALDAGADGVIVPMVNSRADAERAVAACRYAPVGVRSYGPLRASLACGGGIRDADDRIVCLAMVETAAGVERVQEIASVPGLDGIYIGQADLAVSLGLQPELRIQPGRHQQAIDRIVATCQAARIAAGINGDPATMVRAGFRFVTAGSDHSLVAAGLTALRERLEKHRKGEPA
jgi:4-hydroxy-2-oxoheptanedioate aldolase